MENIDTSGRSHTKDYYASLVIDLINKCRNLQNCKATCFVTDTAVNINSMGEKNIEAFRLSHHIMMFCPHHGVVPTHFAF